MKFVLLLILILSFSYGCATSPLGRKQLLFIPDQQMNEMGAEAFRQAKDQEQIEPDVGLNSYVKCVVEPLIRQVPDHVSSGSWEVVVFHDPQANAFALPGGKIGVFTGMLKVAKTDAQLAAVIGHEIGHVIARHGAERVSQQAGTQLGLEALGILTKDNPNRGLLMGLLGIGAQVGVILPFSRIQEREADLVGQDLMARAGFDPNQSIELWYQMKAGSGGQSVPEFLSTHPANESRIQNLRENLSQTMPKFEKARASGFHPVCTRPVYRGEGNPALQGGVGPRRTEGRGLDPRPDLLAPRPLGRGV